MNKKGVSGLKFVDCPADLLEGIGAKRIRLMQVNVIRRWLLSCAGLALCFLTFWFLTHRSQGQTISEEQADRAVRQLWSADERERDAAKAIILRIGPRAIPNLIAVMRDLEDNPAPRYAPGQEEQVPQVEARYRKLVEAGRKEEARDSLEQLMNLKVNWRLERDVCDLLGKLKAEEAIPVLIEAMESEDRVSSWEVRSPQMHALVEIGYPAVPNLIEAIETAESRIANQTDSESSLSEEAKTRVAKIAVSQIQARASIVLGDIGDARALPVLETLLSATDDRFLSPYVTEAIVKIRKKSGQDGK